MESPTFWDNQERAQQVIKQLKPLNDLLKPAEELETAVGDLQALAELADEDDSLETELDTELKAFEKRLESFESRAMLSGPFDAANAYVGIQAGTGGTEACDWAEMLLRMYTRWAETHGYKCELVDMDRNEEAGIRSATLRVVGDFAFGYLQGETGVHRLVRISPFDANARRQTSFAAVDILPDTDQDIEIEVKEIDLELQTFCSGGPGGQHQNKTQSGVRLIHKPTGVRGESRTERSQHKNYDNALKLLKARLYAIEMEKRQAEVDRKYDEKGEVSFGRQIRNYTLQPYTLIKDVRTGVETPQVQAVLDGGIDEFLEAYLRYKTEKEHKRK
jgi:peptide chain release factor 2